jgi:hypothetical protein
MMRNLQLIDEYLLPEHKYLTAEDDCFFLLTYRSYRRFGRNTDNALIMDFKIEMNAKGTPEWNKKIAAIEKIAAMFDQSLPMLTQPNTIFVPMPPSKRKDNPLYDDRMTKLLKLFCNDREHSDLREIISIINSSAASHKGGKKLPPEEIIKNLELDLNMCDDKKKNIILFDDVITSGAHFKACQQLLQPQFPDSDIKGIFIGRTPV